MPYIVSMQSPRYKQISLDDILDNLVNINMIARNTTTATVTRFAAEINPNKLSQYDFPAMIGVLQDFNRSNEKLLQADRKSLYRTFYIPKKSGGLRQIDAPVPELMQSLRELKRIFEEDFMVLYHTSAFAYIKGRCAIDSVKKHQQNESRWFAKFDFHNFFGSVTEDFLYNMLSQIFPFCEIVKNSTGKEALKTALSLCFLNGGLPQGTPISPLLTNIMMIPIDHYLSGKLRDRNEHFVYTRYADDILVSSKYDFNYKEIEAFIVSVLKNFGAPFELNEKKTRYGSSAGSNWNLGVVLNKDNKITIGHKNAKQFKAILNNYICDKKNNIRWEEHDILVLRGQISYYRMIEKDYIDYVISWFNKKYGIDAEEEMRKDLKSGG